MLARPLLAALLALVATASALAGCLNAPDPGATLDPQSGTFEAGGASWAVESRAGGLSTLALKSGAAAADVAFPEGVLVLDAEGRLRAAAEAVAVAPGASISFIPPPGLATLEVMIGGEAVALATPDTGEQFLSGENVVRLLEVQRDNFPHRMPGHESYAKSQEYFASYFQALGYEVEVDPYGTMAADGVKAPAGMQQSPSSMANVVAYKRGTAAPEKFLVFGGHYDVVEATTHGAFDNTGGTVSVLELARAFQNVTTAHTLVFGLWGGEEDGILGSQFWVNTNLDKLPSITAYYNLDVTGLAWPGPIGNPDPMLITGAPDGPIAERLLAETRHVNEVFTRFEGAEYLYQPWVVGGQVGGAGVNAQSDHTPFAAKGVPAMMFSTGNIDNVFAMIHKETDTVENMTAYMVTGQVPVEEALTPEDWAQGRDLLARSYEAQLSMPFYLAVLADEAL